MIHLIKEEHQKEFCPYCGRDLSKENWVSDFHLEHHYKVVVCSGRNKKISIKVDFHGSGHDEWNNEWHNLIIKDKKTIIRKLEDIMGEEND